MQTNFTKLSLAGVLALLFTTHPLLFAQVQNSNINYRADVRQVTGQPALGGVYVNNNTMFKPAIDEDGQATYVRPSDAQITCYAYGLINGIFSPYLAQQTLPIVEALDIPFNRRYDVSAWALGKHFANTTQCLYQTNTINNILVIDRYDVEKGLLLSNPVDIVKTKDGFADKTYALNAQINATIREFWRYKHGTSHTDALNFGTLNNNQTYTHVNNNMPKPGLPNLDGDEWGYANTKGAATPEVNYSFTLTAPATVTISTNNTGTNFNTRLVLSRIVNGNEVQVALNDNISGSNNKSLLTATLCDGTYNVYVEGSGASDYGTFELSVVQQPASLPALTGSITGPSLIPTPRENGNAYVTLLQPPVALLGATNNAWTWQQNEILTGTPNWVNAEDKFDSIAYLLPETSFPGKSRTLQYRRVNNGCNAPLATSHVVVKMVAPDGSISGRVASKNGQPVKDITIFARKRNASLPGSPQSFTYSAITAADGSYTIPNIYYGDPTLTTSLEFSIWAFKPNHGFDFDTLYRTLRNTIPGVNNVNFTDTTVLSISGRTYQECVACNDAQGAPQSQNCPLDSVEIYRDNSFFARSGFITPPGEFGRYSITVSDPGTYKIEPRYRNQTFSPAFSNVPVVADVNNINFKNTTTRTISGTLLAGCADYIGTAELEFTDILPKDGDGNQRPSCFRKRITTNAVTGYFSITLPARKYKVRVVDFTASADVSKLDLIAFFEQLPADSLTRDITDANATLNLVYQRPPTLDVVGLPFVCTPPATFSIFPQNAELDIVVKAYQGPIAKNCPAADTNLTLNTNIQQEDQNEEFIKKTENGEAIFPLKGGTPNIIAPYKKTFNAVFTDRFGRSTTLNREVVVTGLKNNIGSFATVSPEVPLMILHDPPGDASSSFWETTESNETALRFYAAPSGSLNSWAEVKIGASFSAGLGISTETSVWGTIKGSVGVEAKNSTSNETIISTKTTKNFSTSDNEAVVGKEGDVFIGAALNLKYAVTNELTFSNSTCDFNLTKKLMVAQDGFATQYIYSEGHIRNTLIPLLESFRDNPGTTQEDKQNYANQIRVWEQTLENNERNKSLAKYVENLSFDARIGAVTSYTTTSTTNVSSVEFDLTLNTELALELGLEVAGSGASGGVTVGFRMETGKSTTNTTTKEVTFGFTLDDDDPGDFYSVNIKKDPVYNSPVFELVAATTSCPYEEGSQPRDEMQLIIPEPVKTNIAPEGEAEFILIIGNTSQSEETRQYRLSFVQGSNPNGARVTIGGNPALIPFEYTVSYLGQVQVFVTVERGASNIYSYEGLEFQVTDACDGSIVKAGKISAFFQSACSGITLVQPEENWTSTAFDQSKLSIILKDYTLAGLTNVSLEYAKEGTSNWINGFTVGANQLQNSVNGTEIIWNITDIQDGSYNLRAKVVCPSGIVYSTRVSGVIDRTPPSLLGRQQPANDIYIRGNEIAATYDEALDCSSVDSSKFTITRLSNGSNIPGRIGCFENRVVITPTQDISAMIGDSFKIVLRNMPDRYGNKRMMEDAWGFMVQSAVPAVGPLALSVSGTNLTVLENSGDTMRYRFILPQAAPNDIRVNFAATGNALYGRDYEVFFENSQPIAKDFDGVRGVVYINKNAQNVLIKVVPKGNTFFEPDKTLTFNLLEGGDYLLGQNLSITGTILNDDVKSIYTFTGSGNFNIGGNWMNATPPPAMLQTGDEIVIDPESGECILNVPLTIMKGAKISVVPGKKLILQGNVIMKSN